MSVVADEHVTTPVHTLGSGVQITDHVFHCRRCALVDQKLYLSRELSRELEPFRNTGPETAHDALDACHRIGRAVENCIIQSRGPELLWRKIHHYLGHDGWGWLDFDLAPLHELHVLIETVQDQTLHNGLKLFPSRNNVIDHTWHIFAFAHDTLSFRGRAVREVEIIKVAVIFVNEKIPFSFSSLRGFVVVRDERAPGRA